MKRRAFTLYELLIVVGLIGALMLVAGRLIDRSLTTARRAELAERNITRFDSMLQRFEGDVRSSQSARVDTPSSVVMTIADDQLITWQIADDGTISRETRSAGNGAADVRSWSELDVQVQFEAGPDQINILFKHGADAQREQIVIQTLSLARRLVR